MLESLVLGLHLATAHAAGGYESFNPGVYVVSPEGWTAGVLRNSERRTSVYGGMTFETADRRWALTVGGITGYRKSVTPLLVPSVRVPVAGSFAARFSLLVPPGQRPALHVGLEKSF